MALPTCLEMVGRVQEECGDIPVTSLNPGTRRSKIALEGLNDAAANIWQRERWPWLRYDYNLAVTAGVSEYALPANFGRLAEPPRIGSGTSWFYMIERTPELWVVEQQIPNGTSGQPVQFKIENAKIVFGVTPDANFVATYPTILMTFFKKIPNRRTITDGANSWDLPDDFYDAMIMFGKARLKQWLEYPDWQSDMQQYEQLIRIQMNKVLQGRVPVAFRPLYPVVAEW